MAAEVLVRLSGLVSVKAVSQSSIVICGLPLSVCIYSLFFLPCGHSLNYERLNNSWEPRYSDFLLLRLV